jgi:hypothetical protein
LSPAGAGAGAATRALVVSAAAAATACSRAAPVSSTTVPQATPLLLLLLLLCCAVADAGVSFEPLRVLPAATSARLARLAVQRRAHRIYVSSSTAGRSTHAARASTRKRAPRAALLATL